MSDVTNDLHTILKLQKDAQRKEGPPSKEVRIDRLSRMVTLLSENRQEIVEALCADFSNRSEGFTLIELWSTVLALQFNMKHLEEWMKPEVREPLAPDARAIAEWTPKGVVGVIGPWNVPYYLIIVPLAGVIAAGNRAIIKPSKFTPRASALLQQLVARYFAAEELAVVLTEGSEFTKAPFDHIMFTGSTPTGKQVMAAAAANLTPVTLELGGKCPTIVTESFDLTEAAARVMAVKGANAGQICVAPDYVQVPEAKKGAFIDACLAAVEALYPAGIESPDYTGIINQKEFERFGELVKDAQAKGAKVIQAIPGDLDRSDRRFPMTLVIDPPADARVMTEEIFGPILPILGYTDLDAVIDDLAEKDHPLGLFIFSRDEAQIRNILDRTTSGGVTVNDVMAHIYPDDLPFGGVGSSGMGRYHSKYGFQEFSYARPVYYQSEVQEAVAIVRSPYSEEARQFFLQPLGG